MFGVVDELGVLDEDEVYVQLPRREGVLVSEVLVTRFVHSLCYTYVY